MANGMLMLMLMDDGYGLCYVRLWNWVLSVSVYSRFYQLPVSRYS